MAVQVNTSNPRALLDSIYEGIDEGSIETWSYDEDGDFSHHTSSDQWQGQAWLRPTLKNDALVLTVVPPKDSTVSEEAYAVYHGRFIEMLLAHFDKSFTETFATARPALGDRVG